MRAQRIYPDDIFELPFFIVGLRFNKGF
jgi:hypothetical protein